MTAKTLTFTSEVMSAQILANAASKQFKECVQTRHCFHFTLLLFWRTPRTIDGAVLLIIIILKIDFLSFHE